MTNSADPDCWLLQIYTVCKGRVYPGSAGQGLAFVENEETINIFKIKKKIIWRSELCRLTMAFLVCRQNDKDYFPMSHIKGLAGIYGTNMYIVLLKMFWLTQLFPLLNYAPNIS